MSMKSQAPKIIDGKPRITVIGVGGAGGNAINNMIAAGLTGAEFIVANTDAQALAASSAERHIQLGVSLTEGLGAGSKPEIGEAAAEEALDDIRAALAGSNMVFIAAGMGGGTGTGAASVIARVAKEFGILTVAVVTKPFHFEGSRRMRIAEAGIAELRRHVDTLIVIPNQNLFRIANEKTTFAEAFVLADQVLYSGIACIVDLIVKDGLINLDLADVKTVLSGMGPAMMGTGEASGEQRAILAAEEAIVNPLIDDVTLKGAKSLLLSIIGGRDLTLYEVDEAATRVRQEVDPEANIIVGASFDDSLGDKVRVSIVASGMASPSAQPSPATENQGWLPRFKRSANGRTQWDKDYEHRLSEAISGAPNMAEEEAPNSGRRWRGPGDVLIQEGPPPLAKAPAAARAASGPHGSAPGHQYAPESFSPAPPAEIRRRRRMPAGDDLPAAHREHWTTGGRAEERPQAMASPTLASQQQHDSVSRKASLLRRLTGLGRMKRERHAQPAPDVMASGWVASGTDNELERADLPVFFGRGER
jgi:cell division protein FtsZ